jgi:polyphosphate kinase
VAPSHLRNAVIDEIEATVAAHSAATPGRIVIKVNSLVDRACIHALYRASRAGVAVDLNVRGICCLRPGVPDVSENIRVISVVGRFLEHSRVFAFQRDGNWTAYISSADLMPRNLEHRVELAAPLVDPSVRAEVLEAVELCLADTHNAWKLHRSGSWTRRRPEHGEPVIDAQAELMRRHAARAAAD